MRAVAAPNLASTGVNRLLAIRPLWALAKRRARKMMIDRAETIGVPWRETVSQLRARGNGSELADEWQAELEEICNPHLTYPDYYIASFHAYDEGNLGWLPAIEGEVAAKAVHARLWSEAGAQGDAMLRQSYHDVLKAQLTEAPQNIVDLGCGVGMSTEPYLDEYFALDLEQVFRDAGFAAPTRVRNSARHIGQAI